MNPDTCGIQVHQDLEEFALSVSQNNPPSNVAEFQSFVQTVVNKQKFPTHLLHINLADCVITSNDIRNMERDIRNLPQHMDASALYRGDNSGHDADDAATQHSIIKVFHLGLCDVGLTPSSLDLLTELLSSQDKNAVLGGLHSLSLMGFDEATMVRLAQAASHSLKTLELCSSESDFHRFGMASARVLDASLECLQHVEITFFPIFYSEASVVVMMDDCLELGQALARMPLLKSLKVMSFRGVDDERLDALLRGFVGQNLDGTIHVPQQTAQQSLVLERSCSLQYLIISHSHGLISKSLPIITRMIEKAPKLKYLQIREANLNFHWTRTEHTSRNTSGSSTEVEMAFQSFLEALTGITCQLEHLELYTDSLGYLFFASLIEKLPDMKTLSNFRIAKHHVDLVPPSTFTNHGSVRALQALCEVLPLLNANLSHIYIDEPGIGRCLRGETDSKWNPRLWKALNDNTSLTMATLCCKIPSTFWAKISTSNNERLKSLSQRNFTLKRIMEYICLDGGKQEPFQCFQSALWSFLLARLGQME